MLLVLVEPPPELLESAGLGSDFEPGREYTVTVNSDDDASFVAR